MLSRLRDTAGATGSWPPLAVLALATADLALAPGPPILAALALVLAVATWRRAPRALVAAAIMACLLALSAHVHVRFEQTRWSARAQARIAARLRALEERKRELVGLLQRLAGRAAGLPQTRPALAGDDQALVQLFRRLEELRGDDAERPAVAVHRPDLTVVAWSGRIGDPAPMRGLASPVPDVFVLEGNVSTTWVATTPVPGEAGRPAGFVTATFPAAVRRNIRNEFLRDYDRLSGSDPDVEVRYVDARAEDQGPEAFPPLDPALRAGEAVLTAPDGGILAAARVIAPPLPEVRREILDVYSRVLAALVALSVVAWALGLGSRSVGSGLRWLLASTGIRLAFVALGPPSPQGTSGLLSPDVYASTLLGPLLRSPMDLFLTAAWLALLAGLFLRWSFARRPSVLAPALLPVLAVAAVGVLVAVFALLGDTVANCSLELEMVPLLPRSLVRFAMQCGLLLVLAAGLFTLTGLFALSESLPPSWPLRLVWLAALAGIGVAARLVTAASTAPAPLVPVMGLLLLAAVLARTHPHWRRRVGPGMPGPRAAAVVATVAALALLLYPTLVHFEERNTRVQIERNHAPDVLAQPQRRAYVMEQTTRRIDALRVLEDVPAGPDRPGLEELAFWVWSATDLAAFGFSSAIEIQGAAGDVISRFALNLASLSGPPPPLPESDQWIVSREPLTLASAERSALHARRRLTYHGEVHGAVHVWVSDDFWNLPFLRGRDPYSVLFRTTTPLAARLRPVNLVVYDPARGTVVFSSVDRPPALDPALARRAAAPGARWTELVLDGRPHRAHVVASGPLVHLLAYPRLTPERYAADLVEAAAAFTLLALAALLVVLLVRTIAARPTLSLPSVASAVRRRFSLRLFVAFVVLAFVPVAVLQVVVRDYLAERLRREFADQAVERALVAKKAVEDFAFFQRGEAAADPVTDAALVWLASVIRNDLDVFERGRLLASSKRELYASGLLPPRVSGAVYRALVLEREPSHLRPERIGDFSYLVASVPLQLEGPEPGVLSMPLALRQREVEAAVEDLDRSVRLAVVGFLALAAALAQSMARRISGPISALTRATRRVARGDLEARVEVSSEDELRELVEAFNQMARDLDRQRRELERSNRLAAWAEMARQVAHEVKNPLTPIQLSTEHLRRVWRDPGIDFGATLEACTQAILKQVQTLRGMVTEFSAFARPPAAALEPLDPVGVLRETLHPYQAGLPPGVRLTFEPEGSIPAVLADQRLLERAVVNLLENALQAVGDEGSIAVRLRPADGGRRVELEVADSGPGVDPELRERVFEPFFSTKTSGSGLGLALVKKIAEDHGGGVALESAPGQGTRAILWLPAAAQGNVA